MSINFLFTQRRVDFPIHVNDDVICSLAAKLIKIYFSFFSASVKKGEVDTKLMKALLTGVNRAFPYAVLEPEELDKQMETVHKLVHLVSFNISIQALTLLYQVRDTQYVNADTPVML